MYTVLPGDCRDVLLGIGENTVDAVVTDPPYELGFMGNAWDKTGIAYNVDVWRLVLRVLKPGGYLLSFGGSRTYHRMACAIEDAGFVLRDQCMWLYGNGFPKGLNISKALDKQAGVTQPVVGVAGRSGAHDRLLPGLGDGGEYYTTAPVTELAQRYAGWNTTLKPAHEPLALAQKPLSEKTVAANIARWGVGGLNVGACTIGNEAIKTCAKSGEASPLTGQGSTGYSGCQESTHEGRWPANIFLDEEAGRILDEQSGYSQSSDRVRHNHQSETSGKGIYGKFQDQDTHGYADAGGASRFFYCPKASTKEREAGLDDLQPSGVPQRYGLGDSDGERAPHNHTEKKNPHPTVKPLQLMRYLCRLVCPPGGRVLDPFCGSGSTGCAAVQEGFDFTGIELDPFYVDISLRRIAYAVLAREDL